MSVRIVGKLIDAFEYARVVKILRGMGVNETELLADNLVRDPTVRGYRTASGSKRIKIQNKKGPKSSLDGRALIPLATPRGSVTA